MSDKTKVAEPLVKKLKNENEMFCAKDYLTKL